MVFYSWEEAVKAFRKDNATLIKSLNSTIQPKHLAGGVWKIVVKVADKSRDGCRRVETTQNVVALNLRFALHGNGFGHSRFKETGQDGIDPDAMVAVFPGERCR